MIVNTVGFHVLKYKCSVEEETLIHILTDCPAVANARKMILMLVSPFPNDKQLRNLKILEIHKFAKRCNYYRNEM